MNLTFNWNLALFILFIHDVKPCIDYCGIRSNVKSKAANTNVKGKASSRIINAETTDKPYPWVVFIQKKGMYEKQFDTQDEEFGIGVAAGAIITTHTIITCGHCICNNDKPSSKQKYAITCPKDPKDKEENLNKKEINEIYITVGKQNVNMFEIDGKFDENLKAYVYNYEKDIVAFSKNGDIGIVIQTIGLEKSDRIQKICLPTPELFHDGLKVKVAGWGIRIDEKVNARASPERIMSTSCQTNEARSLNRNIVSPFDKRVKFLDCEIYEKDPTKDRTKKCNSWLLDKKLETLPLKIDLPGVSGVTGLNDLPSTTALEKLKNGKEQKRCEEYFQRAKKAWTARGNLETQFDSDIDRIVIKKFETTREEVCFNLKKVAKYGVCSTKKSTPGHWGFCSRSCYVSRTPTSDEPYEVAEFKYFENAPGPSNTEFKSK